MGSNGYGNENEDIIDLLKAKSYLNSFFSNLITFSPVSIQYILSLSIK